MWQISPMIEPLTGSTMGLLHFGKAQRFPETANSRFTVGRDGSVGPSFLGLAWGRVPCLEAAFWPRGLFAAGFLAGAGFFLSDLLFATVSPLRR
jgi:hypothetical protein